MIAETHERDVDAIMKIRQGSARSMREATQTLPNAAGKDINAG
jgi:hypothetical protein